MLNIKKVLLGILCLSILISCSDDNVGEYKLKGDISNILPKNSCELDSYSSYDEKTFMISPNMEDELKETWGLKIKQVDYYLDGEFYQTMDVFPFTLIIDGTGISIGSHNVKANITICGEYCDDVKIIIEKDILKSDPNKIGKLHGDFFINKNAVSKGDTLIVTPELLKKRSTPGCKIDKVEYYWDNKKIHTTTETPYSLNYIVNSENQTHELDTHIFYHDDSNTDLRSIISNYVFVHDETELCYCTFDIKSNRIDYKNGETIDFFANLYQKENIVKKSKIEIFINDVKISESDVFPYNNDYLLSGYIPGVYTVIAEISYNDGKTNITHSYENHILITE